MLASGHSGSSISEKNPLAAMANRRMSHSRRRSSVAPVVKEQPQDTDRCKFKYIHLRCLNYNKTLDFYQALGFNIVWELELEDDVKLMYLQLETNEMEFNMRSIGLMFEYRSRKPKEPDLSKLPEENSLFSKDSILIYIKFISRLYRRLQGKDWKFKITLEEYCDIQYMVIDDPNGLEVRLVECTEQQLVDVEQRVVNEEQWFARFGYYATEVMKGEELVAFYEKILAYNTNNAPPRDAAPKQETSGKSDGSTRPVKKTASTTPNMIVKRGFRLIDSEEIISGLDHDRYWWMANDTRERHGSVNFIQKASTSMTKGGSKMLLRPFPIFIGFGFEVNASITVEQAKKLFGKDYSFAEWHKPVGEIGYASKIIDPSGRALELFIPHNRNESVSTKRTTNQKQKKPGIAEQHQEQKKIRTRVKSMANIFDRLTLTTARTLIYKDYNQKVLSLRRSKSFNNYAEMKKTATLIQEQDKKAAKADHPNP